MKNPSIFGSSQKRGVLIPICSRFESVTFRESEAILTLPEVCQQSVPGGDRRADHIKFTTIGREQKCAYPVQYKSLIKPDLQLRLRRRRLLPKAAVLRCRRWLRSR
ncbi:hypothetical protein [Brucella vulpis]|uniref:hypothetical protein n=1 Tax=Brucella vulpis TaxID=981386 RepID=UPI0040398EAB